MAYKSKATIRKGGKRGVQSTKAMTFKVDIDVDERLQQEANKGRLINDLLREHYGLNQEPTP